MRIGLTGGIGSGKSIVARFWVALGAKLIDTDLIARQLTGSGGLAMPEITASFGSGVVASDGSLDRAAMRQLAFGDPSSLQRLEHILHPLIGLEAETQAREALRQAENGRSVLLFDVPLLVESRHWRRRVDRVAVVDCDEATQVQRVMQRSGWPEAQVRVVMAKQATRRARRAAADAVIHNGAGASLDGVAAEVEALHRHWRGR